MLNFPTHAQPNIPLRSPTIFYLEEEHYTQARAAADEPALGDEQDQWKVYLDLLGTLAFRDWLSEQGESVQAETTPLREGSCDLQLGEFRLHIIGAEQVLSEQIAISSAAIESPTQAAHFYVLLEIAEEHSEVWFRGFMRHDQLSQISQREEGVVHVPLDAFEPEPSRLLSYCRHLEASAIALPQAAPALVPSTEAISDSQAIANTLATARTRLSQWLDNIVDESWQAWELLQPQVAYATRSLGAGIKCGKLVNLKMQVAETSLALVLTLTPEADDKVSILVQLLPTGRDRLLPPNVQLSLMSRKGRTLQTLTSRSQDNYVQLKSFKGKLGMHFSLTIQIESVLVTEEFEI